MKKNLLVILILIVITGCSSIDSPNYAQNISGDKSNNGIEEGSNKDDIVTKAGLVISGEEAANISTDYFGVLKFTFRNTTDEWVRIKRIKVYFDNEEIDKNVYVPVGEELSIWQDAVAKKIAIDSRNSANFWTTVGVISGITAIAADDRDTSNAAGAVFGGSVVGASISDYKTAKKLENIAVTAYPKEHLMSGKILVPPGLFVNRFIVLNSKNNDKIGYLSSINIEYETEKGVIDKVKLPFRKNPYESDRSVYSNSRWQKKVLEAVNTAKNGKSEEKKESAPYN